MSADGRLTLRVYRSPMAGPPVLEVHSDPELSDCFVRVNEAGAAFMAELGYYSRTKEWSLLASSPPVSTPQNSVGPEPAVRLATMVLDAPAHAVASQETAPSAEAPQETMSPVGGPAASQTLRGPAPVGIPVLVLGHSPGATTLLHGPPVPGDFMPEDWVPQREPPQDIGIEPSAPEASPSQDSWPSAREQAILEVMRPYLVLPAAPSSVELAAALPARAQAGPARPVPSVAAPSPEEKAPSLGISSLTLAAGAQPPVRAFWFNINAELVIYGATEPGAKVLIGGKPIQLRPDGSFTCRFALPDGIFSLPALAVAADGGAQRTAEMGFSRLTRYQGEVGEHPPDPNLKPPAVDSV